MEKLKLSKKLITIILIGLFCLSAMLATLICLIKPNTNSFTTSTLNSNNATIIGELWDSTNKTFSKTNANTLLQLLSSDGSNNIKKISNYITSLGATVRSASEIRSKNNSKSIIVTLGGIQWIIVYLSIDSNNNPVATLYQADASSTTSYFAGNENSSGYDNGSNKTTPSNMYSRSYIRAVTLNAGSAYYDYGGYSGSNSSATKTATQSKSNPYALFTMSAYGLTQHLVQPKNIPYQVNSQGTSYSGASYIHNNESLTSGTNYSGWDYATNSATADAYAEWGNDYIWLPSISETGKSDSLTGIWQLSSNERSHSSSSYAWVRSSYAYVSNTAYTIISNNYNNVSDLCAIRPALHLNLKSIYNSLYAIGEIWDSTNKKFNYKTAQSLLQSLSPDGSGKIDMISNNITNSGGAITAIDLRENNNSNSVIVMLGGLDWLVTYLTIDTNGNPIATLYRTYEDGADYFAGDEDAGGSDSGNNITTPSNMYSRSYIRAVTLNAGSTYYDYGGISTNISSTATKTAIQNTSNKYAMFTMSNYGLTKHLVQPKYVPYQINSQGYNNHSYNINYELNNESLTTGSSYSGYNYATNSGTSSVYNEWGNDYIWIPSLSEIGENGTMGIWQIDNIERSFSKNYIWTRSAKENNSYRIYQLLANGSGCNLYSVHNPSSVRPALHLNLQSLYKEIMITAITLDQQSGSGGTSTIQAYKNESLPTITPPTRSGFAFGGYFSSTNGSGTKYYNADGTSATTYPVENGPTTLYAYWIPLYTLTINSNDSTLGTVYGTAGSYQANTTHKIYAITKAGYSLLYWSVKNANGTEINKIYENEYTLTMPAHNVTYTAVFGGGLEGINISSTYGGMVAMVGDNFESLSNSDTITLVATVCVTGYQFKHWINQDGEVLASGEENKTYLIPKSQAMDSIITAVFEPIT